MKPEIQQLLDGTISNSLSPWLPDVVAPLAANAWRVLAGYGFHPGNYGTHRWLHRDPSAGRLLHAELDLGAPHRCAVEALPISSRTRYEELGLVFMAPGDLAVGVPSLESALTSIALVSDLYVTVATYLRSVHLLKAPGPELDVSHSDPEVPFSIFVSIPPAGSDQKWRLAESIVHECMHLHLTTIETTLPLVDDQHARAFSPWQQRARPLRGVLHGLYVSCVIDAYFRILGEQEAVVSEDAAVLRRRRRTIAHETAAVANLADHTALTNAGRALVKSLLRGVRANKLGAL